MKIVHIISSLQRGGAEMALANLLQHLQGTHCVLYFHDGPVRALIEEGGIPCIQIYAPGSYANPLFFVRLLKNIKQHAPDLLHTDLWAANLLGRIAARLLKIPCISVVHAMTEHEGTLRATIDRFMPCTPTQYVAVSPAVQTSLQKNKRLRQAPCMVIENGIAVDQLQTTNAAHLVPQIASLQQQSCIIGAVGRLIPEKNYDLLLKSFAQLLPHYAQIQLVIVGSGPEEQKLKQLAEQLQITHHITWVGNQLAHPYYQFFDCYVQPSRSEGLSIALLEALASTLPVIVTGKDKHHAVIQDKLNGLVIEPDNLDELTGALQQYLDDVVVRTQYGNRGYETVVQNFSLPKTVIAYQTLFENTLRQAQGERDGT